MFTVHRKELMWAGRKLVLETGKIARQADGAVLATYGETVVLCTAVAQRTPREGIDFFPLTIEHEERMYAALSTIITSSGLAAASTSRESGPTRASSIRTS